MSFAGHTDWRLPNVRELESIVDHGRVSPSVNPVFNTGCTPGCTALTCSCTVSDLYWSSTVDVGLPAYGLCVEFIFGNAAGFSKTGPNQVRARAVRGGAGGCPLPATGQTTCWDNGGNPIACTGTGQDGDVRAGSPPAFVDNGDGTVTDRNTRLVWEKKSADGTIHDQNAFYTWSDAFALHIAGLNAIRFGGHNDWRLPNVRELESIAQYDRVAPAVNPAFNTGCTPGCTVLTCSCTNSGGSAFYWTSTTNPPNGSVAWIVEFGAGTVPFGAAKNGTNPEHVWVRAVRGG
jgi:hypothetical protein